MVIVKLNFFSVEMPKFSLLFSPKFSHGRFLHDLYFFISRRKIAERKFSFLRKSLSRSKKKKKEEMKRRIKNIEFEF